MVKQMDPRVIRTRKLIMDGFIELAMENDFYDITIKDITTLATVNRATFYNHFYDKYDLLEKVLSENMMSEVIQEVSKHEVINEESMKSIFLSIIQTHTSLSNQCSQSYEAFIPKIEALFKIKLQNFFSEWAEKQWPNQTKTDVESFAVILSWALYGAAMHWMQNQTEKPEDYVKQLMSFVKNMDEKEVK